MKYKDVGTGRKDERTPCLVKMHRQFHGEGRKEGIKTKQTQQTTKGGHNNPCSCFIQERQTL